MRCGFADHQRLEERGGLVLEAAVAARRVDNDHEWRFVTLVDPPHLLMNPGLERPPTDVALIVDRVDEEAGAVAEVAAHVTIGDFGFEVHGVSAADLRLLWAGGDDPVDQVVEPPLDVVERPGDLCADGGAGLGGVGQEVRAQERHLAGEVGAPVTEEGVTGHIQW